MSDTSKFPWEDEESVAPKGSDTELAELKEPEAAPAIESPVDELKESISDAATSVSDAIEANGPAIVNATISGSDYVVTTQTMSGQQIKLADAKSRAFRTLFQNLGIDMLVAVAAVLPMIINFDFANPVAWAVFGTTVAKTVVNVFVSYIGRLAVTPVLPTPVDPGISAKS